jgi:hypothetical protein
VAPSNGIDVIGFPAIEQFIEAEVLDVPSLMAPATMRSVGACWGVK